MVRRIPLTVVIDGNSEPTMAVELAARALGSAPVVAPDGTMTLAGYRIPSEVPTTMALNFDGGADGIPTYSLADLRTCIEQGNQEFFRRYFAGKVVIVGTTLDVEDRQVTSKRFATAPENSTGPRCALPAPKAATFFTRDSTKKRQREYGRGRQACERERNKVAAEPSDFDQRIALNEVVDRGRMRVDAGLLRSLSIWRQPGFGPPARWLPFTIPFRCR